MKKLKISGFFKNFNISFISSRQRSHRVNQGTEDDESGFDSEFGPKSMKKENPFFGKLDPAMLLNALLKTTNFQG